MTDRTLTAFLGAEIVASGPEEDVAAAVRSLASQRGMPNLHVFDDATGKPVDIDRVSAAATPRPAGRPKLGVVAREVTLLPRHWEWLASQPGGASAALRRLVEAARKEQGAQGPAAREAAYRFMLDMAGDRPGYEEATRALFAGDRARLEEQIRDWPDDVRDHALRLAAPGIA